jgi:Na+-translocating ferredoxin:NAD+ oxidoreductase RnfG subunit
MTDKSVLNAMQPQEQNTKKPIHLMAFLGSVCLIATAALASVNSITSPIIEDRINEERAKNYLEILEISNSINFKVLKVDITNHESLKLAGVYDVTIFENEQTNEIFGIVYDISTKGWKGDRMRFQVGFKEMLFSGFKNLENFETDNIGGVLIDNLNSILKGIKADNIDLVNDAINIFISNRGLQPTFSTLTRSKIIDALEVVSLDYIERIS